MTGVKTIVLLMPLLIGLTFCLCGCQGGVGRESSDPVTASDVEQQTSDMGPAGGNEQPSKNTGAVVSDEKPTSGAEQTTSSQIPAEREPKTLSAQILGADLTGLSFGMEQSELIELLGEPTVLEDGRTLIYTEPPINISIDGAVCTSEVFLLGRSKLYGVYFYMKREEDAMQPYSEIIKAVVDAVSKTSGSPAPIKNDYIFSAENGKALLHLDSEGDNPEFICEKIYWEDGMGLQVFHYNDTFMICCDDSQIDGYFWYNPLAPTLGNDNCLNNIEVPITTESELLRLVDATPISVREEEIEATIFGKEYVFNDGLVVYLTKNVDEEEYSIYYATANSPGYVTQRGLRVGDSVEELIRLYGMPTNVLDERTAERQVRLYGSQPDWMLTANEWTYSTNGDYPSHEFVVVGGYVTQIHIYGRW
jgi:hypothetical protein